MGDDVGEYITTMGAAAGNIMATIIPTHMARKTGIAMSLGARPPTWPRPETMSDLSLIHI